MVGALWIDSGSDTDIDVAHSSAPRPRRSQDVNAVAGPSRTTTYQPRRSPRPTAPRQSSPCSIIALSSSQDQDEYTASNAQRSSYLKRSVPEDASEKANALLAAGISTDSPLPSFRDLVKQHKSRSNASPVQVPTGPNGSTSAVSSAASRVAPISQRAGSLRRTASQPTASSSQEGPLSSLPSLSVRRPLRKASTAAPIPEVIEIGSDSIADPASEADAPLVLPSSSPIRSQFSARHQLSSSQPLPFSPPRNRAAADTRGQLGTHLQTYQALQPYRAESAPIVILSSSPPPPSLPRTSQRSFGNPIHEIAEHEFPLPELPPSSFPFDDPPPSPPFSPVDATEVPDTSPSLKRRSAASNTSPSLLKRSKTMNRTTSLLDALDKLYEQPDVAMPRSYSKDSNPDADHVGNDESSARADPNSTSTASASPSKAQKAAAAKQAREAKARDREAAKAAKLRAAAEKKRFLEVNRLRTSKADTMRELIVDLDRSLFIPGQPLASCQESLTARFQEQGASVDLNDGVVAPPLVRFRRKLKAQWNAERRHWVPLEREEVKREAMVIVYMDAKEIVQVVGERGEKGLENWYGDLKRRLTMVNGEQVGEPQVFLICQGLVKFYSRIKANENRAYTARIRQQLAENQTHVDAATTASTSGTAPKLSRRKAAASSTSADATFSSSSNDLPTQALVERSLLALKLIHRCYVIHAASLVDGVEWLHQLTGDLSLKPYKSLRDTHLSFAVDTGRNTTSSSSSSAIYTMLLQQIPRVTPAIASSITTLYPSLHSLIQAYQACKHESHAKTMLSTIHVHSNKNGTQRRTNRLNLGLQLSKRIHAVIRGTNPHLLINHPTKD